MEQQNLQLLSDGLNALSAAASDDKVQLLAEYCRLVTEANARFNLTAILDERDFVIKHILDSAAACTLIPHGARLLDIGSGAGFPAVPLAILRDDIRHRAGLHRKKDDVCLGKYVRSRDQKRARRSGQG